MQSDGHLSVGKAKKKKKGGLAVPESKQTWGKRFSQSMQATRGSTVAPRASVTIPGTKTEFNFALTSIHHVRRASALKKQHAPGEGLIVAGVQKKNNLSVDEPSVEPSSGSYFQDSDAEMMMHELEEEQKLTLAQTCGLNTMNMFGTGPFITIPFVVASADPPGPHAMIGYSMAAFACMNDSLIWAELGSMWPDSGGSYVYLRELYGPFTWGRLLGFLFVWQIMVSGPMECASGFIATAQYIAFITEVYDYYHHALIAFFMCGCTVWALYREINEVGTITLVLWAFTIAAIIFTIIAGYLQFTPEYVEVPSDAFADKGQFIMSLGVVARFAVYDFTGYYDVNFVGKEVKDPTRNIPIACVATCCIVAMCFLAVDVAVIGSLQWDPDKGGYVELVTSGAEGANYIMATFCETHIGYGFAVFFTVIVCITIFGSCFSFMIGLAQIPYTAAKDGYFYNFLAHEHEKYQGLQDYSLLLVGGLSTIFCFVDLEIVIEGMLTMQLLVQFMCQAVGLIYYRFGLPKEDQEKAPFSVPLFPIPNIIQLCVFGFVFITTDNYFIFGGVPLLELCLLFLVLGCAMYLSWASMKGFWPFAVDEEELSKSSSLTGSVVLVGGQLGKDDTAGVTLSVTDTNGVQTSMKNKFVPGEAIDEFDEPKKMKEERI